MREITAAEALFRQLLQGLRPMFKANGFRARSQNFLLDSPECWGMINFQKSRYSSSNEKSFTINLAIASKRILKYHGESTAIPPPYYACHWETRIGWLLPERQDKWWTLSTVSSLDPVQIEVREVLANSAIPLLHTHLSERGLIDLWQNNLSSRLPFPMLKDKSVLLALDGKLDELQAIFQAMRDIVRGTRAEPNAEDHIARLRNDFGLPELRSLIVKYMWKTIT